MCFVKNVQDVTIDVVSLMMIVYHSLNVKDVVKNTVINVYGSLQILLRIKFVKIVIKQELVNALNVVLYAITDHVILYYVIIIFVMNVNKNWKDRGNVNLLKTECWCYKEIFIVININKTEQSQKESEENWSDISL